MKTFFLLLVLASCASKPVAKNMPAVDEKFYLLFADRMECGLTTVNGIDISPRAMMAAYPRCHMEYKGNEEIKLFLLDCTREQEVGNVLIYTKDLESCIKTKYLIQELKDDYYRYPNQKLQEEIKL